MAAGNSLGRLVVELGLDSAEFTSGLTKSEYQAKRFADSLRRDVTSAIRTVGAIVGGLAIGDAIYESTKAIIAEAAAMGDLADVAGSSVEEISRLANQAKVAGTDFNTLQGYVQKLATSMAKSDDESQDAARALQKLGIVTKDPVQAFQQIAVELSKYDDGLGKVAIATALFGKQGAAVIPILKDIAELQDVGATLTKKQADEAEALQRQFARLSVESTAFKNAILSDVVPALTRMIEDFREGIRIAGGFWEALRLFGTLSPFGETSAQISRLKAEIADLQNTPALTRKLDVFGFVDRAIADRTKQLAFLESQAKRSQAALAAAFNAGDPGAPPKKTLDFSLNAPKTGGRSPADEAKKYIEQLEAMRDRTLELTTVEQVLKEIQTGRLQNATHAQKDAALAIAEEVDAYKELERWIRESAKAHDEEVRALQKAADERARITSRALDEAEHIARANEDLRDEIAIILGGERVRDVLEKQRVDNAIAIKEEALALAQLDPLRAAEADALRIQIDLLKERSELLTGRSVAKQLAEDARALQDAKNLFADSFADAFSDFISGTKSAKDAFKSFVDDITRQISRIAAQNIANLLFGGTNKAGPDILSILFGSIFGGGGGGGFTPGPQFGFAAKGSNYTTGGPYVVGEQGPEIVVPPRGAKILPGIPPGGGGGEPGPLTIIQNIGAVTNTQTARQAAKMAADRASFARRRG